MFHCNVIAIREEETQEEYSSNRGDNEPWIWLLCEQAARCRSRIEEQTREHGNYKSKLKDTSQDQSASRRLILRCVFKFRLIVPMFSGSLFYSTPTPSGLLPLQSDLWLNNPSIATILFLSLLLF